MANSGDRPRAALLAEAAAIELKHGPVSAQQVLVGSPTAGVVVIDERDGVEIGVWS